MSGKRISHTDLALYNMRTKMRSSSILKETDVANKDLPRILYLEDQQLDKRKERKRDVHINIYREFFSNTSNTKKNCIENFWLASDEVVLMDIHTAASLGDCGGIDAALARFENISYCSHLSGWTPLMFAASRNHVYAVKHLISKGANVCTHSKKDGRTAFALAASGGSCEIVAAIGRETLRQKHAAYMLGANLIFDANNELVQNILPWLRGDFSEAYEDLVSLSEEQKQGLDSWDFYGWTALMHAVYFGTSDVVKLLVQKGCNINVADINGKTPLIVAVECLREDIVFTLLNAGANPTLKTKRGVTAADYADISEYREIIDMIQSATEFRSEMSNGSLRTVILILAALGLRKYIPIFIEHDIDSIKFNLLTEKELRDLGVVNMGPRKKVLSAIRYRLTETK